MSIEVSLAALQAAVEANTAVNERIAANQERLIAGQQTAIDKIEGATAARRTTKDKPAAETPAAEKPAVEEKPAAVVEEKPAAAEAPVEHGVTSDEILAAAKKVMGGFKSLEERNTYALFLQDILEFFGFARDAKLTGPESKLDAEQRKQALFFIERKAAGKEVNFSADYDFDGAPDQGPAADPLG